MALIAAPVLMTFIGMVLVATMITEGSPLRSSTSSEPVSVDLALVLAVDASRSMGATELSLQRDGYIQAFRHGDFLPSLAAGPHGRIAVLYFEWAGPRHQVVTFPWMTIESQEDAERVATALERLPLVRPVPTNAGTSIAAALLFAQVQLKSRKGWSARQVVDISANGINNIGPRVTATRDQLVAEGIVINGLPIDTEVSSRETSVSRGSRSTLVKYFEHCVIGGPGAFIVPVLTRSSFGQAIRQKIYSEIVDHWVKQPTLAEYRRPILRGENFDCEQIWEEPGR